MNGICAPWRIGTAMLGIVLSASLAWSAEDDAPAADERAQLESLRAELDHRLEATPDKAALWNERGAVRFKLGDIDGSIEDFDQFLKLVPQATPSHWQRGISYYYAERFLEGQKQFEKYQTFDSNDVENAVWRYLCMARKDGVKQAQADILKIGDDRRVPMRQVYDLFAGHLQPDDVLAAAQADEPPAEALNQRLFYAHLYLGLYYEVHEQPELAKKHLGLAAQKHRIGHYMWDVARVHYERLQPAAR